MMPLGWSTTAVFGLMLGTFLFSSCVHPQHPLVVACTACAVFMLRKLFWLGEIALILMGAGRQDLAEVARAGIL